MSRPALWFAAKTEPKEEKELAQFQQKALVIDEIQKENERLKKLLELRESLSQETMAASVIGRDPAYWFRTLFINKGANQGVRENMPVINNKGLVGLVVQVMPSYAKVQLVIDMNSRVAAISQRTREMGILKGEGVHGCLLDYLPKKTLIEKGDIVVSSGMGSLYPKGIPIGEVEEVEFKKKGLYQTAKIRPAVDFNTLEEVLILKTE